MSISFMRTNHECFWKNSRAIVPVYPTSQSFASSGYWRHIGPGSFCSRRSALVFLNMFLLASNPLEILQIVSFIVNIYGFPWISMITVARNTQRMLQQTHHHWWFGHSSYFFGDVFYPNCSCGTRPCSWCLPSAHCHFLKGWRSWRPGTYEKTPMQKHHQWPPSDPVAHHGPPPPLSHCFTKSLELDLPRNDRHLRRLPKRKAVSRRLQLEAFLHLPTAKPGRSKAHSSKVKAEPTNHFCWPVTTLVLVSSSLQYPFRTSPKPHPPRPRCSGTDPTTQTVSPTLVSLQVTWKKIFAGMVIVGGMAKRRFRWVRNGGERFKGKAKG